MIRTRALVGQVQEGYARRGVPSTSIFLSLNTGNQKSVRMRMGLLGTLGHLSKLVSCTVSNYQGAVTISTSQGLMMWVLITCREPNVKSKDDLSSEGQKGGELK